MGPYSGMPSTGAYSVPYPTPYPMGGAQMPVPGGYPEPAYGQPVAASTVRARQNTKYYTRRIAA